MNLFINNNYFRLSKDILSLIILTFLFICFYYYSSDAVLFDETYDYETYLCDYSNSNNNYIPNNTNYVNTSREYQAELENTKRIPESQETTAFSHELNGNTRYFYRDNTQATYYVNSGSNNSRYAYFSEYRPRETRICDSETAARDYRRILRSQNSSSSTKPNIFQKIKEKCHKFDNHLKENHIKAQQYSEQAAARREMKFWDKEYKTTCLSSSEKRKFRNRDFFI